MFTSEPYSNLGKFEVVYCGCVHFTNSSPSLDIQVQNGVTSSYGRINVLTSISNARVYLVSNAGCALSNLQINGVSQSEIVTPDTLAYNFGTPLYYKALQISPLINLNHGDVITYSAAAHGAYSGATILIIK